MLLLALAVHIGMTGPGHFTLTGTINGSPDGMIYIRYAVSKGEYKTDSSVLKDGRFLLQGRTAEPAAAVLATDRASLPDEDKKVVKADGKNAVLFFLEPADVHAALTAGHFKDAVFSGSATQQEFTAYNAQGETLYQFIGQHPESYVSAFLLTFHHVPLDSLTSYYNRFPQELQRSTYGKAIRESISKRERVTVGRMAPDFTQADKNGKKVSLKDFRGMYVLLEFWSSWNKASQAENQELLKAYHQYKDLVILGASLDGMKTRALWKAAVDSLPWIQLAPLKVADNPVAIKYCVEGGAVNYLIGPDGRIVEGDVGAEDVGATLGKVCH